MSQETPATENNAPSSASAFKERSAARSTPKALSLPSGLVVLCKRPSISMMMQTGIIPTDVASAMMNQKESHGIDLKMMPKMVKFQKAVIEHAVVQPRVTDEPGDDTITFDDLEDEDRMLITGYVQEGSTELKSFRDEPTGEPAGPGSETLPGHPAE